MIKKRAFEFREVGTDRLLLREKNNGEARTFRRDTVAEEPCLHVTQRFVPTEKEGLYGLGQYQTGVMNYRGDTALLLQANMDIVNPFLIIDTGYYGIIILKPVLEIMNRDTVSIRKSEMPQIIILFMGKIWMR